MKLREEKIVRRSGRLAVLLSFVVVGGCVSGGALLAGFIRGVVVDGDPEYCILIMAVLPWRRSPPHWQPPHLCAC